MKHQKLNNKQFGITNTEKLQSEVLEIFKLNFHFEEEKEEKSGIKLNEKISQKT